MDWVVFSLEPGDLQELSEAEGEAMSIQRLKKARVTLRKAQIELSNAIRGALPPGHRVLYQHGNNIITAFVLQCGTTQIRVQGRDSGKIYWLDQSRIIL